MFCAKLVEIGRVLLEKKRNMWKFRWMDRQQAIRKILLSFQLSQPNNKTKSSNMKYWSIYYTYHFFQFLISKTIWIHPYDFNILSQDLIDKIKTTLDTWWESLNTEVVSSFPRFLHHSSRVRFAICCFFFVLWLFSLSTTLLLTDVVLPCCTYRVTVETPSTNFVLNSTLALLNIPSFRETTINWKRNILFILNTFKVINLK